MHQQTEKLILEGGNVYSVKVLQVKKRNKQIRKKDDLLYDLYDVLIENKEGKQVSAEYVTRDPENKVAETFVVGVGQFIRCGIVSKMGTPEIEPSDEPNQGLQQRIKPQNAAIDGSYDVEKNVGDKATAANAFSVPVSGRSITFAMGYAKDILVAELAMKPQGYEATDEDLKRMIHNANVINDAIIERVTF